ncbi:MAG: PAS domain S-box protein [Candidatus Marinimicrobia bacterium]|jgi:PAS domain S-box-containing protein|nr:PAS domain S-box protein [Candidatus Neomarinimicrobiota bacterium]MBT3634147.1 PAS domain S-box protein [Candidatus Neomarinimicrobiota bacterium]MBT3683184.1 PAS domain S-box protein [Candidatus Neomarinimicrobiota bacterium]MBT3759768.1 PAS domain S-box protein [Candidatus Neomarinimicrobiota bacterium]MBT3895826.1 PAS domain S-box protein [Candidatus Neomarinimicrobiota bacterium]
MADNQKSQINTLNKRIKYLESELLQNRRTSLSDDNNYQDTFDTMFLNHPSIMLLICPISFKIINANPVAHKFYGYKNDFLTSLKYHELTDQTDEEIFNQFEPNSILNKYPNIHILSSGSKVHVEEYTSILHRSAGKILFVVVHDVSEKKASLIKLRNSEENFHTVFDGSEDAIFIKDKNLKILNVNKAAEKIFGYTREEFLMDPEQILGDQEKNDYTMADKYVHDALNGIPQIFEWWGLRKGNVSFREEIVITKTIYNGDDVLLFSIQDISIQKNALIALTESEIKFKNIVENTDEIIYMIDQNGIITLSEGAGLKLMGVMPGQLVGQSAYKLYEQYPVVIEGIRKALSGEMVHLEVNLDGIYYKSSFTPHKDLHGKTIGLIGMSINISEVKLAHLESEDYIRQLDESQLIAQIGSYHLNIKTSEWFGSEILYKIFGIDSRRDKDVQVWINILYHDDRENMVSYFQDLVVNNKKEFNKEYRIQRENDGQIRWVHGLGEFSFDENGESSMMIGTIQDITDRKKSEEVIRKSEIAFGAFIETSKDWIWSTDFDGIINFSSPAVENILGYNPSEMEGKRSSEFIYNFDKKYVSEIREKFIEKKEGWTNLKLRYIHKKGGFRILESSGLPIIEDAKVIGFRGIDRDITDRMNREELIRKSLEEKEILLKEIHHRVKNNFQVIISLLSLQGDKVKDKHVSEIFSESQNRIRSMSLVHENLYAAENYARINFKDYIDSLLRELFHFYCVSIDAITLKVDVKKVEFDLATAIPLGLVINELVTNIFKYAFPGKRKGTVEIIVRKHDDNETLFIIKDNGIGLPESIDIQTSGTLGLQLVHLLAEKQLGGRISINRSKGTEFKIFIPGNF